MIDFAIITTKAIIAAVTTWAVVCLSYDAFRCMLPKRLLKGRGDKPKHVTQGE